MFHDIAIFGGAFNPITTSHLAVAMAVHCCTGFKIHLQPCYKHKFNKNLVSSDHRVNMCRLISKEFMWLDTSDFEVISEYTGSTYDLMKIMQENNKKVKFHLVIGSDNADILCQKWENGRKLAEEFPVIVVGRQGTETKEWDFPHNFINLQFPGCSSTSIREWIVQKNFHDVTRNLDERVWSYIQQHHLYE